MLRHHRPHAPDQLAAVLRPHTEFTVGTARDAEPVVAGRILVAPPGRHTLVTPHGRIALIVSGDRPPYRPSADLLLTSLALSAGPCAVAVVLSGYGNDGATGATAVHHFGGTVIASDRATSTVFTMPSAAIARDEIVDHVLPVDAIADVLITTIGALAARTATAGRVTPSAEPDTGPMSQSPHAQ